MAPAGHTDRAEALLERLRICAFIATEAARDGDLERLHQAIEERELLMSRAEPLLAQLRSGAAAPESDARSSLLLTLEAVAQADAQLIVELECGQREIAASLLELTQDARPTAYQAPAAVGLALDLIR